MPRGGVLAALGSFRYSLGGRVARARAGAAKRESGFASEPVAFSRRGASLSELVSRCPQRRLKVLEAHGELCRAQDAARLDSCLGVLDALMPRKPPGEESRCQAPV